MQSNYYSAIDKGQSQNMNDSFSKTSNVMLDDKSYELYRDTSDDGKVSDKTSLLNRTKTASLSPIDERDEDEHIRR